MQARVYFPRGWQSCRRCRLASFPPVVQQSSTGYSHGVEVVVAKVSDLWPLRHDLHLVDEWPCPAILLFFTELVTPFFFTSARLAPWGWITRLAFRRRLISAELSTFLFFTSARLAPWGWMTALPFGLYLPNLWLLSSILWPDLHLILKTSQML